MVQYLYDVQKADAETRTQYSNETPLHFACKCYQIEIVQYLYEVAKVNTEAKNNEGNVSI